MKRTEIRFCFADMGTSWRAPKFVPTPWRDLSNTHVLRHRTALKTHRHPRLQDTLLQFPALPHDIDVPAGDCPRCGKTAPLAAEEHGPCAADHRSRACPQFQEHLLGLLP